MSKNEWLSVPQYAKRVGKTRQYIAKLVRTGKITKKSLKPDSSKTLINPFLADADLDNNVSYINKNQSAEQAEIGNNYVNKTETEVSQTEKQQRAAAAGTRGMSLADAQKLQAQYKAALLKLEYEEKSGKLIKVSEVEKDAFDMARIVRDAILNVPDRISAELASITDVHIVSEKLTSELTEALEELSK